MRNAPVPRVRKLCVAAYPFAQLLSIPAHRLTRQTSIKRLRKKILPGKNIFEPISGDFSRYLVKAKRGQKTGLASASNH
jgi:hypothetical protein